MKSTRLPGKVIKDVCGEPLIARLVNRVRGFQVIVAAGVTGSIDIRDALPNGTHLFTGDDEDVLKRFYDAIKDISAEYICRLTADCVFIDAAMVAKAFEVLESSGVDYVGYHIQSKNDALGFPDGMDIEVFTREALYRAHSNAKEAYEREHVTTWMRRHLDCITIRPGKKYPVVKLSVDTAEDLERVRQVYKAMLWHKPDFSVDDVGLYLRGLQDGSYMGG